MSALCAVKQSKECVLLAYLDRSAAGERSESSSRKFEANARVLPDGQRNFIIRISRSGRSSFQHTTLNPPPPSASPCHLGRGCGGLYSLSRTQHNGAAGRTESLR